jgi:hypothetical protein
LAFSTNTLSATAVSHQPSIKTDGAVTLTTAGFVASKFVVFSAGATISYIAIGY